MTSRTQNLLDRQEKARAAGKAQLTSGPDSSQKVQSKQAKERKQPLAQFAKLEPVRPTRQDHVEWLAPSTQKHEAPGANAVRSPSCTLERTTALWRTLGLKEGMRGKGVIVAVIDDAVDTSHSDFSVCAKETLDFCPYEKVAFELYGLTDVRRFSAYCGALRNTPRKEPYYRLLANAINALMGYERFPSYERSMVESYGAYYSTQLALEFRNRVAWAIDDKTGLADFDKLMVRAGLQYFEAKGGRKVWYKRLDLSAPLLDAEVLSHGTHVASIACGRNGEGHTGVAPDAKLVALKVGNNILGRSSLDYIEDALAYALYVDADVVNLSLGSPSEDRLTTSRVKDLLDAGTIICAATGNAQSREAFSSSRQISYPSRTVGVLSIGCADTTRSEIKRAPFSEIGHNIEFLAPGVHILAAQAGSKSGTSLKSGTSMACPYVAGVAALIIGLSHWSKTRARARAVAWVLASHCEAVGSTTLPGRATATSLTFNDGDGYGCVMGPGPSASDILASMNSVPSNFLVT